MISESIIRTSALQSTLAANSVIAPKGAKKGKHVLGELLLTPLIDAFAILVIFLLMNFSSTGDILMISKGQELPKARMANVLERNPVIKIEENNIFVEDKLVDANTITAELLEHRKKYQEIHEGKEFPGIATIQADRRVKYELLNKIILGMNQAGYSDIRFAVVMK